jgi:hypothetical protein
MLITGLTMLKLLITTTTTTVLIFSSLIHSTPVLSQEIFQEKDLKSLETPTGNSDNLRALTKPDLAEWPWQVGGEDPGTVLVELDKEKTIFQEILPEQIYDAIFPSNPEPIEPDWQKNNQGDYNRFTPRFSLPVYKY